MPEKSSFRAFHREWPVLEFFYENCLFIDDSEGASPVPRLFLSLTKMISKVADVELLKELGGYLGLMEQRNTTTAFLDLSNLIVELEYPFIPTKRELEIINSVVSSLNRELLHGFEGFPRRTPTFS